MIRTLIFGAGRMAQSLLSIAHEFPGLEFVGQVSLESPTANDDRPLPYFTSLDSARKSLGNRIDLLIDFSLAQGTPVAAHWCGEHGIAMLSGVTGIDQAAHAALDTASETAPVLWAPNLSFGINLLAGLIREVSPVIGEKARITIEETHHLGKKDAPSGTALYLAEQFQSSAEIEFLSRREGEVVGEHAVKIELPDETLTLSHHAEERRLFARGALEASQWLVGQNKGRYSAADWISSVIRERFSGPDGQV